MTIYSWGASLLSLLMAASVGATTVPSADVIARAAGHEFRSADAASIMASNPNIPADAQVVRQLVDLWIDYTLLATAAAEDSSFSMLNLDQLFAPERAEQEIVRYLQARAERVANLTDVEIDHLWRTEGPGEELHARHILLLGDANVTPEQMAARAEAIRSRAAQGEDFATLAGTISEDPGSKDSGGDLGWFGRDQMVPEFESAAFKLQPGEVSPVVETQFGYHVIKLDDRRFRPIGDNREHFRQLMQGQAQERAVEAFVASRRKLANLVVRSGAEEDVRSLAAEPSSGHRSLSDSRHLVSYNGGEVTDAEIVQAIKGLSDEERKQFRLMPESQIRTMLETQAVQELLLAEAHRENFGLTISELDALRAQTKQAVLDLVEATGLVGASSIDSDVQNSAQSMVVLRSLTKAVVGQQQLMSLGGLGHMLRQSYDTEVIEESFEGVLSRLEASRNAE